MSCQARRSFLLKWNVMRDGPKYIEDFSKLFSYTTERVLKTIVIS